MTRTKTELVGILDVKFCIIRASSDQLLLHYESKEPVSEASSAGGCPFFSELLFLKSGSKRKRKNLRICKKKKKKKSEMMEDPLMVQILPDHHRRSRWYTFTKPKSKSILLLIITITLGLLFVCYSNIELSSSRWNVTSSFGDPSSSF